MYQFIECPLQQRKITLSVCSECEHHRGVKARLLIEKIGMQGEAHSPREVDVSVDDIASLREALSTRVAVSERGRWLDCHYPRTIRLDVVYGG